MGLPGPYERGSGPLLFFCFISVCSDSIPCALRAGERGLLWGRCPPSRPLSKPPNHPPYLALRLCVHCPPVPTKASLSEQAGAHIHPRMGGGMKLGQGCYPSCVPRPAAGGIAGGSHERGSGPPLFFYFIPVCSNSIPCALRAVERGLLWGRCPPSRPLSKPPNHPPYLALRLCVHCPPVPTKASLSEQAGAHIHPRMGGGMKSGQGCYPSCVPRPAVGGIAGVRARPENLQTFGRAVRREGGKRSV